MAKQSQPAAMRALAKEAHRLALENRELTKLLRELGAFLTELLTAEIPMSCRTRIRQLLKRVDV